MARLEQQVHESQFAQKQPSESRLLPLMQRYQPVSMEEQNPSYPKIPLGDAYDPYQQHSPVIMLEPLRKEKAHHIGGDRSSSSSSTRRLAVPLIARLPALVTAIGSAALGVGLIVWLYKRLDHYLHPATDT